MTTQTPTRTVQETTVANIISTARHAVQDQRLVPLTFCTDTLLDCFNAAPNPTVKSIVEELLPHFTTGRLRRADDLLEALEHIQVFMQLDDLD